MKFNRFEEIGVWKLSRILVTEIYKITDGTLLSKDFSLKDQIRRSAISIPCNIAEGYERKSNLEFVRYLYIAKGSAGELRTQLYLAYDLQYINDEVFKEFSERVEVISKSLSGFIKYLQKSI